MANRRVTHNEFVTRSIAVHGDKYQYVEQYKGSRTKIAIVCPTHGQFYQYPYSHLEGSGCKQCDIAKRSNNNKLTHEQFVKKASRRHNNKYTYNESYQHSQQPINIQCPVHGEFTQLPYVHLLGSGCKRCADDERIGMYTEEYFAEDITRQSEPGQLYVFRLSHDTGTFIKVGITKNIKTRIETYKNNKLVVEQLLARNFSMEKAWRLEQNILERLKTFRYYPNHDFCGKTECLKNNPRVLDLIHLILDNSDKFRNELDII